MDIKWLALKRYAVLLCVALCGCQLIYGGEGDYLVWMQRPSDGAKTFCDSGTFNTGGLFSGKADAQRIFNACILACRKHGFVEEGQHTEIDEAASTLKPEEGWANTPRVCQS